MTRNGTDTRRLKRILAVRQRKRQLEEWRLVHLGRERAELENKDRAIIESLNDESALHGLFLEAKTRSLKRNDVEKARNAEETERARTRLQTERRLEKRVERAEEEASRSEAAQVEKKRLDGAIESLASRLRASFE